MTSIKALNFTRIACDTRKRLIFHHVENLAAGPLILRNAEGAIFGQFESLMAIVDEQSRLAARIADFELRIAEARENRAALGFMGNVDQDHVLQMLVRALRALKARQAAL